MLNSLLGIARQWSGEKFAIWTLKPRSHVRILMYMLLRCCYYYMLIVICIFFMGIKFREDFLPSKVPYRPPYRMTITTTHHMLSRTHWRPHATSSPGRFSLASEMGPRDTTSKAREKRLGDEVGGRTQPRPQGACPWIKAPWGRGWAARPPPIEIH